MVFSRIMGALAASNTTGAQAVEAARMGFLEWVFSATEGHPAHLVARADLKRLPDGAALSPAAQHFVGFLTDAAETPIENPKRRGGRRRVLH